MSEERERDEFGRDILPKRSRKGSSPSDSDSDKDHSPPRRRRSSSPTSDSEKDSGNDHSPPRRRGRERNRSRSPSPKRKRRRRSNSGDENDQSPPRRDAERRRSTGSRSGDDRRDNPRRGRHRSASEDDESGLNREALNRSRRGPREDRAASGAATSRDDRDRWGPMNSGNGDKEEEDEPKEKPNFGLSGALNEDLATGNVYKGIVLKWSEPPEAKVPTRKWRLHVFKGDKQLQGALRIYRQSAYLIGKEQRIADVLLEHPSCSRQHAVIQFRLVNVKKKNAAPDELPKQTVKPYVMDLQSANGTYLNNEKIPDSRYIELKAGDVLKFGYSSREYVLLHDQMV